MFLALRELWYARMRFGLMGGVVTLISILTVMLSGLSSGLVDDGVSGLRALPVDGFAFADGTKTDSAFTRSTIDTEQVASWRARPDVAQAAPFGNTLVNAKTGDGVAIDFALFGVEPDSFLAPAPAQGSGLAEPDGIVVSDTALENGAHLGDTVVIDRLGTTLRIVGVTSGKQTFGHVDVAYVPLRTWQEIHAGAKPGEAVPQHAYREASAVALQGSGIDLAAGDAAAHTSAMTRDDSYDASPGFSAEMATMSMIKAFLYAISALVVGAFFLVWTIQRSGELAVLRAIGAPTRFLLVDGLAQALVVLVGSTALGVLIAVAGSSFIQGMPFSLDPAAIATGAIGLIVLGLVGAAAAIVRVTRIDPLTALGAHR